MRTPLSRVRHFGSAHGGTDTFWMERITAAASLILTIFFVGLVVGVAGRPYADVIDVLGSPWVAALSIMFIVAVAMHMRVGMEAIIVDYVPKDTQKIAWLIANTFFSIAVAAIAILAILKITLGS